MLAEVYDAFVAAGVPDDKARKAAEALASRERRFDAVENKMGRLESRLEARFVKIDGELNLHRWMIGLVLAFQAAMFAKMFLR